ncbi:MAG: AAA family ATPase [Gemmatimonadetes bacterium]|nr:AAA family ATPase [Gemmatimonadota bacterium]
MTDAPPFTDWVEERRLDLARRVARSLHDEALAARAAGDFEDSGRLLRSASRVHPESQPVRLALVEHLLDGGRIAEARQALGDLFRDLEPTGATREAARALEQRIARSTAAGAVEARAPLEPAFVGRGTDLAQLLALFREVERGASRIAVVQGPSGIGKSRLLSEVRRSLGAGATWVDLRAHRGAQSHRFGVLADLVETLTGLPGAAGIHASSDQLLKLLLTGSPGGGATLASLEIVPLAGALRDLIEAVTAEHPVVLAVDDVQWADAPSLAVLVRALLRLADARCLALVAQMEEGATAQVGLPLLESAETTVIRLRPLTADAVREVLESTVEVVPPEATPEVARQLHHLSAGLPLHLAAAVRALRDRGWIDRGPSGWRMQAQRIAGDDAALGSLERMLREEFGRLPEEGRRLAADLASGTVGEAEALRLALGFAPAEFEAVVADLVERGWIQRADDGRLLLAHDRFREAVLKAESLHAPTRFSSVHGRRAALAAVAGAVLLAWAGSHGGPEPAADFPYGEGLLLLYGDGDAALLRPPEREGGTWRTLPAEPALGWVPQPNPLLRHIKAARDSQGRIRWFATRQFEKTGPGVVELSPLAERLIADADADETLQSVGPGSTLLIATQRGTHADPYQVDQLLWNVEADEFRRVLAAPEKSFGALAPDGERILAVLTAPTDSLTLLSPSGRRLWTRAVDPFQTLYQIVWCTDARHFVARAIRLEDHALLMGDAESGEWEILRGDWTPVGCFGPAAALALLEADARGQTHLVVRDLRSAEHPVLFRSPLPFLPSTSWIPDRSPPTPRELLLGVDSIRLDWGGSAVVEASLLDARGRVDPAATIEWRTADPDIASVDPQGRLSGNTPGHTLLVAEYAGWLADTAFVEVGGGPGADVLLVDRFFDPDLTLWVMESDPAHETQRLPDGPALAMLGDGRCTDGMRSRSSFRSARGLTLEARVRLPLTRRDRQRWELCLLPDYAPAPTDAQVCLTYPTDELSKFDDLHATVRHQSGQPRFVPAPELADGDWHHVALQVRADGEISAVVDRRVRRTARYRFPVGSEHDWRVLIAGHSVDTELHVRDLVLWQGIRYGVDGVIPREVGEP